MPTAPPLRDAPRPAGVEERFLEAGGVRFRYLSAAGPAVATRPTVLLVHGFLVRSEVWLPVLSALAARGPVVAVDLPGHGGSSPLPGKDGSIGAHRRSLAAFVDALGPTELDVVGSSLGGALGAMLAVDRPERVRHLVLLAASGLTPKLPGTTVRLYFPLVLRSYLLAPGPGTWRSFLRKGVFHDPGYVSDDWAAYLAEAWRPRERRSRYLATANAMRAPDASVAGELERVRARTSVVWGREDAHFPWTDGEAAATRIPGATFTVHDGCGHLPMIEKFDVALPQLLAFLES